MEAYAYPDYPLFKGLQKPLEFMGFRGRYIWWVAATVGGGILGFIVSYIMAGFLVALIIVSIILAVGGSTILVKQHQGLHSKKVAKGIFIYVHSRYV